MEYNNISTEAQEQARPLPRSVDEKVLEFYRQLHNEKLNAFYESKESWLLPRSEYDKLLEIHQKLHSENNNNQEDKIIAALELAARCQHLSIKEFD